MSDTPPPAERDSAAFVVGHDILLDIERMNKEGWHFRKRGNVTYWEYRDNDGTYSQPVWVINVDTPLSNAFYVILFITYIIGALLIASTFVHARRSMFEFISGIVCTVLTCVVTVLWLALLGSSPGLVSGHLIRQGRSASEMWSYCDRCSTFRPPRTIHCHECQVCVEGYDHHCPFSLKCIGKGNVRVFNAFVTFFTLHIIVSIAIIIAALVLSKGSLHGLSLMTRRGGRGLSGRRHR